MKLSDTFPIQHGTLKSADLPNTGPDQQASILEAAGPHYFFECQGSSFAYTYIRKNACSAFKNFICDTSSLRDPSGLSESQLSFLNTHHKIDSLDVFASADIRMFVYRDPIERAISLYKNKFIMCAGNADMFKSYAHVTGKDPAEATFTDFVNDYLSTGPDSLDPHCRTQHSHLLPMHYTHAIHMDDLFENMSSVIGETLATQYFSHRVNASTAKPSDTQSDTLTSSQLHDIYTRTKSIPKSGALLTPDVSRALHRIYEVDFDLLNNIKRSTSAS